MYFANPYFLFGLFALLIPIIIHLFNFRRYRIFYFSNTRFLQELKQQTNRQSKIRKLIILFLRMLAISMLVIAFARPHLHQKEGQLSGSSACIAIYIDNSFSMENSAVRGNLLDEARSIATAIADAYRESDRYMLITNDFEGKHQQFLSRDDFKQALDELQISPASKDLSEVYAYGLRDINQQNVSSRLFYFISDFQLSTSNFKNIQPDPKVSTYIVPLTANAINNVYLDTLWLNTPSPKMKQQASIHAIIRNVSDNDMEKLPVKLFINNSQKALSAVDIAAKGYTEVQLNFMIGEEAIQNGYVEILDHPVIFDDKLYFSLLASNQSYVLSLFSTVENIYLKPLFGYDTHIVYQSVNLKNINYSTLKEQNLVIIEQTEELASGLVQELVQYVKQGGNLLILPSTDATAYNNTLNTALGVSTFGQLNTTKTEVAGLNLQHALYKNNVFDKYPENISLPSVMQYFVSDKAITTNKEIAIRLENGDDFLVSHKVEKGNVYLLAVGLSEKFSDFPLHALFVPSLYNMSITFDQQNQLYYTIGQTNSILLHNIHIAGDNILEIKNKNNSFIPEIKRGVQGIQLYVHNQMKDADNYLLWNKDSVIMGVSFNYNRKESDMQFLTVDKIKEYLSQYNNDKISLLDIQNKPASVIEQQINNGVSLYFLFVIVALLALLAEGILIRIWK
ncbi:MAG: BatA domain-containing protein [Bacteroidales bacterium]|nr:BatA domain-containing protein [Bacteroidales bacterium]